MQNPDDSDQPKTAAPADGAPDKYVMDGQMPDGGLPAETADPKTDAAVADIMKSDSDAVLEAQDAAADESIMELLRWERFKRGWQAWWGSPRKRYWTIGTVVVLLGALFAVPVTRYDTLGLVIKNTVAVHAVDSKSGAPVSGVTVTLAGKTAETDANGLAVLRVPLGSRTLEVSKTYYKGTTTKELVTLSSSHNNFKMSLTALGRQVRVKVVDKVSGKPVPSAVVAVGIAKAKTDKNGDVTVVTPVSSGKQAATVSVKGYNDAKVTIAVGGDLAKNTFALVPAGKLYFLSNLSGRIDVVKTNLDGSDRQVVLEGTGNEDRYSTSLLASRDWKYLALLAKRSGKTASVYLMDTTDKDKLTTIDEGDASFNLIGWSGSRFVYQVTRTTVQDWQPDQQVLKSFDATSGQTLLLDQTQATGTGPSSFSKQTIDSAFLLGDQVAYVKGWGGVAWNSVDMKSPELDTIRSDGSGHRVVEAFAVNGYSGTANSGYLTVSAKQYEADGIYLYCPDCSSGSQFYEYDNGKVSSKTNMTADTFYESSYATYLLSPSGSQAFWADPRDGKNMLFTGDQDGKNSKTVASLSDYTAYGWYSDNYLLVSKNSSELYIMSKDGGTPLKITDYYKPAINYQGYGGGYGGL